MKSGSANDGAALHFLWNRGLFPQKMKQSMFGLIAFTLRFRAALP